MQPFALFSCHKGTNRLFPDLVLVNKFGLFNGCRAPVVKYRCFFFPMLKITVLIMYRLNQVFLPLRPTFTKQNLSLCTLNLLQSLF
jgi:hypothetical protein